ncbi:MAG: rRNA pseudouridine synthase [Dehalococcoidia bacterium]|nr:rRNA pseudouridine synthase [Dehalococcoidia bacterium]
MLPKPLLKTLTEAGVGSRRRLADAIRNGRVRVNGVVAEDFRQPIDLRKDSILVNGVLVNLKPQKSVYLLLNKPKGCLSTTSDDRGRMTVLDILPSKYRSLRLYPVGRLDKNTTGLLLLTNDGELTYRLTHPKFECEKEYLFYINSILKANEKMRLQQGVKLEDGKTSPARVRRIASSPPFNYSITIREGKKRQVRLMLAHLGHRVLALKRIREGDLILGDLQERKVRELNPKEVRILMNSCSDG